MKDLLCKDTVPCAERARVPAFQEFTVLVGTADRSSNKQMQLSVTSAVKLGDPAGSVTGWSCLSQCKA